MNRLLPIMLCVGCVAPSKKVGTFDEEVVPPQDIVGDVTVDWRVSTEELALNIEDIAVDDDGVLTAVAFVASLREEPSPDEGPYLLRISADGEVLSQRQLSTGGGVQVEALGRDIVVAYEDETSLRVARIDPSGVEVWSTGIPRVDLMSPQAMVVDAAMIAVAAHDGRNNELFVHVLEAATGAVRWTDSEISDSFPTNALALLPDGRLAMTWRPGGDENHAVVVLGQDGTREIEYPLDPEFRVGRARAELDGLRLAGWRNDRLLSVRLGFDGSLQTEFEIPRDYGWAIEFTGEGLILGGDLSSKYVTELDASGEPIWRLDSDVPIFGVAVFGDRVYAYDTINITAIEIDG